MRKYKILLADDDPFILIGIGKSLEMKDYQVITAKSGKEACELLDKTNFDIVITDLVMDEIDGIQVLKKAKALNPETMVIILTGYGDLTSAIDALRLNVDDYILKPCEHEEIYFRVARCIEKLELEQKIKLYEKILPVCCVCKKIRDDSGKPPGTGKWVRMEEYITKKTKMDITSTYCHECAQKIKKELDDM